MNDAAHEVKKTYASLNGASTDGSSNSRASAMMQLGRRALSVPPDPARDETKFWQDFSVKVTVASHRGAQKTLPVLSMAATDPFKKQPKKSSLKYVTCYT